MTHHDTRASVRSVASAIIVLVSVVALLSTPMVALAADENKKKDEADIEIVVGDEGVSLYAVSADAHEVLSQLARVTDLPLIVDDTVNRKVTVNLVN